MIRDSEISFTRLPKHGNIRISTASNNEKRKIIENFIKALVIEFEGWDVTVKAMKKPGMMKITIGCYVLVLHENCIGDFEVTRVVGNFCGVIVGSYMTKLRIRAWMDKVCCE